MNTKVLIVAANYYKDITKGLLNGATNFLKTNNIDYDIIYVPGAFEISLTIKHNIKKNLYKGYVTLGCIIKGDTIHFDLLSQQTIYSINKLMIDFDVPISFGVLTCNNIKEAEIRSEENSNKNKGIEAASACLEMINILKK
mgnify:CR=1 FL=1